MKNCKIVVKVNNESKKFDSMEALDAYLYEHQDSIDDITLEDGIMFDTRPEHEKLKEMFSESEVKNMKRNGDNNNVISASPSDMWTYIEDSSHRTHLSAYSEADSWTEFKRKHPELSGSELISAYQDMSRKATDNGTVVHDALEHYWKTGSTDHSKGFLNILANVKNVQITLEKDIQDALSEFHGSKMTVIPEQTVFSKFLDEDSIKIITEARKTSLKAHITAQKEAGVPDTILQKLEKKLFELEGDSVKGISPKRMGYVLGRIDLIVQDEFGVFHLYDYKSHNTDHTFSDKARKSALYQLETYAAILRQAGFKVGSVGIIEIGISDKSVVLEKIERFNKSTFPLDYRHKMRSAIKNLIPYHETTTVTNISEVEDTMETLCPKSDIAVASRRKQLEVEYYLELKNFLIPLSEDHPQRKRGNTHVFFRRAIDGDPVYCNEETKVKKISQYIAEVNENKADEMNNFAETLQSAIAARSLGPLENYVHTRKDAVRANLLHTFRKYINGGWNLIDEEILIANNFFIFEKDGRYEIVLLDTNVLNHILEMRYNNTLIGNSRHDLIDNSVFLDSRRGHWLLMKAMALIAHKPNLFESGKIQSIEAINLYEAERSTADLSTLITNWNLIVSSYTHKNIPRVREDLFMPDTTAKVRRAIDWMDAYNETSSSLKLRTHDKKIVEAYTREEIFSLLRNFAESQRLTDFSSLSATESWKLSTYNELIGAYLTTFNIHLFTENGIGELWTDRNPGGTKATPLGISQSAILRRLQNVNAIFEEDVQQRFDKEIVPWQLEFKKVYNESPDRVSNNSFFDSWFERDASGNIDQSFSIKPVSELPANQRKLATLFLDTLAKYRGWTPEEIARKKVQRKSEYYQIPLIKATTIEAITNKGSVLEAIGDWWKKLGEMDWEKALGLELTESQKSRIKPLDIRRLENVLLGGRPSERQELLSQGVSNYSRDLDKIINVVLGHSIRSELSETYIPAISGFRVFLQVERVFNPGADLDTIENAIEEWIKSVVFGRSLVNPHEMFLLKLSELARRITSGTTLIGSFTSLTREMIVSTIANALDTKIIDQDLNDHDSWEMLGNAYWDTVENLGTTTDITSKDQQMNTLFAVAGININSLGKDTRSNAWNWRNIDGDILYVFQTAPDYLHRLSYLKAKLMKRGSYNAYKLVDGVLTYSFADDEYYAVYWKYKDVGRSGVPTDKLAEFDFQKAAYEKAIASWQTMASHRDIKIGDELPQALSPEELMGVHNNCNLIHGFYNESSKVLLQKHLVGAFFFQFKTVPLARMAMMFHPTQAINNPILQPILDEHGQQMYVHVTPEHPEGVYKTAQEIKDEGLENSNDVRPVYASVGIPLTGKANVSAEVITTMWSYIAKNDQEAWDKFWKDPWKRRTGFIAMWDLFGMAIISFLLKLAFPEAEKDIKSVDWLTRFSYTVLTGASQDRGIFNTITSITGDGAPPSMAIIKRYITTASSVISGNMPLAYGVLSTFGATRPLSNIVADY